MELEVHSRQAPPSLADLDAARAAGTVKSESYARCPQTVLGITLFHLESNIILAVVRYLPFPTSTYTS